MLSAVETSKIGSINSILVKLFSDSSQHIQECLRKRNEPHD